MALVQIKVDVESPSSFEMIDVEFPIYVLSGYNSQKSTTRRGVDDSQLDHQITKIISPTEMMSIRIQTSIKSNGEREVNFTTNHEIESEPETSRKHFFPEECSYNVKGTKEDWDEMVKKLHTHIKTFI